MENTHNIQTVKVILPRAVKDAFTYTLPEEMSDSLSLGDWVEVPLGNKTVIALVYAFHTENNPSLKLKAIIKKENDYLKVHPNQLTLIEWFKHYYHCNYFTAFQTIIGKASPLKKLKAIPKIATEKESFELNAAQKQVIHNIQNTSQNMHYLCGITGSGKTAVYVELAKLALAAQKQSLILVPEIALTQQLKHYFERHFGEKVIVLHSGLTPAQKRNARQAIAEHRYQVIIGPRSALFSPFDNLGLIVIDEEHENSYKQDQHPRYHGHSVAKQLAEIWQAKLVFGSATPSLDTLHEIESSQQSYLTERVNQKALPQITLIDSQLEEEQTGRYFSQSSIQAIKTHLDRNEKVLIFINRRGYAPYLACQKCEAPLKCEGCGLHWTYHSDTLCRCHRCQLTLKKPKNCLTCQKGYYQVKGLGTQRCDVICKTLFPNAKIVRLDKDNAKTALQIQAQLDSFKEDGNILIGTQMIAKGLHIEDVTLVIFLGIDNLLNFPDFRASERAYQLLVQVAGRAGRGQKAGKILVETQQIDHPVLQNAIHYDLEAFTARELSSRERFFYPPYSKLINLLVSCPDLKKLNVYLESFKAFTESLKQELGSDIKVYGPKACPIEKIRFHWRFHCLIKYPKNLDMALKEKLAGIPIAHKDIRVFVDIDPRNIL